jgi:hypothetical protein
MAHDERNDQTQLDQALDSLLASYSRVEPRPGLETRVLASVRAHAEKKQPYSWPLAWLCGATLTAALAMVFVMNDVRNYATPEPPAPVAAHWKLPPAHNVAARNHRPPRHASVPPTLVADVRQQVFPTPVPLSPQEKLMYRYLAGTPREELVAQGHPDNQLEEIFSSPAKDEPSPDLLENQKRMNNTR